jgi:hypothetical protein
MLRDIPGWMHPADLEVMAELARKVPDDGLIVEVGSWMGQSTQTWCQNTRAEVIAIDKWEWMPKEYGGPHKELVDLNGDPFEQFKRFTAHLHNLTIMKRPSSGGAWTRPLADLVFIDAMHQNPWVHDDIIYWETKVKPGGVICGDDYSPVFPAIVEESAACAERFGVPLGRPHLSGEDIHA